jgi:protein-tyrosine phosphatase
MTLAMAGVAVDSGTASMVLTPHHLSGSYRNPRKSILKSVAQCRLELARGDIALDVYPGSELHLVDDLASRIAEGDAMTYNDRGRHALVELPAHFVPNGTEQILERILYNGCTPVIAHPERNSYLCAHPERLLDWVSWGCCAQLTAQSIAGDFGSRIQGACRFLCNQGVVHLVASDAHRPQGRSPNLRPGYAMLSRWLGEAGAALLMKENPARLLRGEALKVLSLPAKAPKRSTGLLSRMLGR